MSSIGCQVLRAPYGIFESLVQEKSRKSWRFLLNKNESTMTASVAHSTVICRPCPLLLSLMMMMVMIIIIITMIIMETS